MEIHMIYLANYDDGNVFKTLFQKAHVQAFSRSMQKIIY